MSDDLHFLGASELSSQIRSRTISCEEVVRAFLQRLDAVNTVVNAVVTVDGERALDQARSLDGDHVDHEDRRPLLGVPVTVKDLTPVAGTRTTMGSTRLANNVASSDGALVSGLRQAGAIIMGKTNTPEFGCKPRTDNRLFGATRNPHNTSLSSGGSSGGAAAAVAAGLGPVAEGSDLAGSIRQPAAWCGVVGYKPSQGRVPRVPNPTPWNSMAVNGSLARTVGDAAVMVEAMTRFEPKDPLSVVARPATARDCTALRIAWSPDLGGVATIDPRVVEGCRGAVGRLADAGLNIEEASPDIGAIREPFLALNALTRYAALGEKLSAWRDDLDPILVSRLDHVRGLSARDIATAEAARAAHHAALTRFFDMYDILLTPATALLPQPLGQEWPITVAGRTYRDQLDELLVSYAFNLSSLPAVSLPCTWTTDGLPIGLQVVAPWHEDACLLAFAARIEEILMLEVRRPCP